MKLNIKSVVDFLGKSTQLNVGLTYALMLVWGVGTCLVFAGFTGYGWGLSPIGIVLCVIVIAAVAAARNR